jgi:acyl dehydratase
VPALLTYARAAAPLVPLASRLPFVAGGGGEMPALERERENLEIDRGHLAAYSEVCGFGPRDTLPATYPHVLAFGLHMELMTDGRFPFPAIGLVHIANRIRLRRPIDAGERLALRVHPTPVEPHPRGRAFSIVTEARAGGELVWEGHSTMLRRGGGGGDAGKPRDRDAADSEPAGDEWSLGGDLGRRYAAASGDRNPIHLSAPTAKLFGFPRAIAHGMWTKARCVAALEPELPDAFTVEVQFRRPILLPARVAFSSSREGDEIGFSVRDVEAGTPHLEGTAS